MLEYDYEGKFRSVTSFLIHLNQLIEGVFKCNVIVIMALNISYFVDTAKMDFFGKAGDFSSPGYPNFYPDYLDNVYQIRGTAGNTIEIIFYEISLQPEINCPSDYLSV